MMNIRIAYFIIAFGLFDATFLTFSLLGDDIISAFGCAAANVCAFLIILYIMVRVGRWRW